MNDEYEQYEEVVEEGLGDSYHEMMKLFDELSFGEKVRKVREGLKAPKDSGQYKYARLQMIRLSAPAAAILVPFLAMCILVVLAAVTPPAPREVEVRIIDPEEPPELEEIEEPIEEPPEPPEPVEMEIPNVEVTVDNPVPSPPSDFSPQPAPMDAVAMVKSPIIMKGMFGSRNPGSRGNAIRHYGGSEATEGAVMRALRWLKKYQSSNGSWTKGAGGGNGGQKAPVAFTAMGVLTFLAHGETPGSPEFGQTVKNAIQYLVGAQSGDGRFSPRDNHDYTHPIATYALCEAYGLTRVPAVKEAATEATKRLLQGQHADGGFDYNLKVGTRKDVSYAGWCYQALKAAKMAGLEIDGIDKAQKKGIKFLKASLYKNGMAAYTMSGDRRNNKSSNGGLTGVNVLGLQLLGAPKSAEARQGLTWMADNADCVWSEPWGKRPVYYWYYATQAHFHAGGETWNRWNKQFAAALVNNQVVIPKAIEGPDGEMKDIGYWESPGKSENYGRPYNTTLCALQLQVYYRYLPTFKAPEDIEIEAEIADDDDVKTEIAL